jgi:hypothetical protein
MGVVMFCFIDGDMVMFSFINEDAVMFSFIVGSVVKIFSLPFLCLYLRLRKEPAFNNTWLSNFRHCNILFIGHEAEDREHSHAPVQASHTVDTAYNEALPESWEKV